jgi:hypothetical protein
MMKGKYRRAVGFIWFLAIGGVLLGGGKLQSAEVKPTVIGVVAIDSHQDLMAQADWLGGIIGMPNLSALADGALAMATGGAGLGLLDKDRPLGVVVALVDDKPAIHGFIPVANTQAMKTILESPNTQYPRWISLEIQDGWVVITPKGQKVPPPDPLETLRGITSRYSIGMKVFPSRMPKQMQEQVVSAAVAAEQNGKDAADDFGKEFPGLLNGRTNAEAIQESLNQTAAMLIGLTVDIDAETISFENRFIAAKGSAAESVWASAANVKPTIVVPSIQADEKRIVYGQIAQSISKDASDIMRESVLGAMTATGDLATADDKGAAAYKKAVLSIATEFLGAVLETGRLDACLTVDSAASVEGIPLPLVTVGVRVHSGKSLGEKVKSFLEEPRVLNWDVEATFDAEERDGFVYHDLVVQNFGCLSIAVADDQIYMIAGSGTDGHRLALDQAKETGFRPIAAIECDPSPLSKIANEIGSGNPMWPPVKIDGEPLINFLMRPIEGGVASRLRANGDAIQFLAAVIGEVFILRGDEWLPDQE